MKYVYLVLFLAFIGFGGLVIHLAEDFQLAAYSQAFIAAFAANLWWQSRYI